MDAVRRIKTPAEIVLMKSAADVLDEAFIEVFGSLKEGDTGTGCRAPMVANCMQHGATHAHGWMNSHRSVVAAGGQSDFAFGAARHSLQSFSTRPLRGARLHEQAECA